MTVFVTHTVMKIPEWHLLLTSSNCWRDAFNVKTLHEEQAEKKKP
jgi:hypothetical protein